MTVDGLLFDMGDVLYDATAWRRWLAQLLCRMGVDARYPDFFRAWDRDYLHHVHCGRRDYGEAFRAFLLTAGLSSDQVEEVAAASRVRKRELEEEARPFTGVRMTLARLRAARVVLGVLSDSESSAGALRERLARLGLTDRFDVVVSSRDLGCTKPEPDGYRAAAAAMGLATQRVAFVGHEAEELAGAKAVGMSTIAFNYEPHAVADLYLERFDELLAVATSDFSGALAG